MPRIIALEWDQREARVLVASTRGEGVVFEQAFQAAWQAEGDAKPSEAAMAAQLGSALAAHGIRRGDALVAVGRNSVELKQLQLPPAPDEELPDMVRWQAQREFHSLGEAWPLDYVPLAGPVNEPRNVLAAAVSPELIWQISNICVEAGLKPEHIVLRSCASAAHFLRSQPVAAGQVRLLVDVLADEVELAALMDHDVVFLRTARLRGDVLSEDDAARGLLAEIRRTLAAVSNQLGGRRAETIHLCGSPVEFAPLAERIGQELSLPTSVFAPWSGLQLDGDLARRMPSHPGRFAALIGMALDAAAERRHAIDFLNPRKAPPPPSSRRKYALYGAVAATIVIALVGTVWLQLRALDSRIEQLAEQLRAEEPLLKAAQEQTAAAAKIDDWLLTDITWLDELHQLGQRFPKPADAMLTALRFGLHAEGGVIAFDGLAREASTVDEVENSLRDQRHTVEGLGRQQGNKPKYPWQFKTSIVVRPPDETAAPPPEATPPLESQLPDDQQGAAQ